MKNFFLSTSTFVALIVPAVSHSMFARMSHKPNRKLALWVNRLTYLPFGGRMGVGQVGLGFSSEKIDKAGTNLNTDKINFLSSLFACSLKGAFNERDSAFIRINLRAKKKRINDLDIKNFDVHRCLAEADSWEKIIACKVKKEEIGAKQAEIISEAKKTGGDFNQEEIDLLCCEITKVANRIVQNEIERKMGDYNLEKTEEKPDWKKYLDSEPAS